MSPDRQPGSLLAIAAAMLHEDGSCETSDSPRRRRWTLDVIKRALVRESQCSRSASSSRISTGSTRKQRIQTVGRLYSGLSRTAWISEHGTLYEYYLLPALILVLIALLGPVLFPRQLPLVIAIIVVLALLFGAWQLFQKLRQIAARFIRRWWELGLTVSIKRRRVARGQGLRFSARLRPRRDLEIHRLVGALQRYIERELFGLHETWVFESHLAELGSGLQLRGGELRTFSGEILVPSDNPVEKGHRWRLVVQAQLTQDDSVTWWKSVVVIE